MVVSKKKMPAVGDSDIPPDAFNNKQLALFQTFLANSVDQRDQVSNAIDIWDSIPRYAVTKIRMNSMRTQAGFLEAIEVPFNYRGRALTAMIHPARIAVRGGERVSFYPSAREELIEHALRKIAAQQSSGFHDSKTHRAGARFSLHQLRRELELQGHSLRYDEITQGLDILSLSAIEILATNEVGDKAFARSTYLSALSGVKRKDYDADRTSKWSAQFHPLVAQAIDQVTYRQFNYQRLMQCRTQLARWLMSQLVLKYTQAALFNSFEMRYSTIRRDSALLVGYGRERDAIAAVVAAMKELQELGALEDVVRNDVRGPRKRLLDIAFTLTPTREFVKEQKAANRRAADARESTSSETLGQSAPPGARTLLEQAKARREVKSRGE